MPDWAFTDYDRELFDRELESFVPQRVFDTHAHLYAVDHMAPEDQSSLLTNGPRVADAEAYLQRMGELLPGRSVEGLFFAIPRPGLDIPAANDLVAAEAARLPGSRGQLTCTNRTPA